MEGVEKDTITRNTASLAKVTGVRTASLAYNTIKVSWNRVSGATGYVVYRRQGILYHPVMTTTGNAATFRGLTCGNTYYYRIAAYRVSVNKRTYGAKSGTVSAKPVPAMTAKVKIKRSRKKIRLRWKKVAGATGYLVSRATRRKGKYKKLKRTTKRTYTDKVKRKKKYYYRIRAYKKVYGIRIYGKPRYFTVKSK